MIHMKVDIFMKNFMKNFNDLIADKLSNWLSKMAMFYGVTFLVLIPLFFQRPAGFVAWMQYLVSVFFQGVALPVLGYTAQKSSALLDKAIKRIDDNTLKTEKVAERIEHIVNIIEKNEKKVLQEVEKN
jgi:hypothetical protein